MNYKFSIKDYKFPLFDNNGIYKYILKYITKHTLCCIVDRSSCISSWSLSICWSKNCMCRCKSSSWSFNAAMFPCKQIRLNSSSPYFLIIIINEKFIQRLKMQKQIKNLQIIADHLQIIESSTSLPISQWCYAS